MDEQQSLLRRLPKLPILGGVILILVGVGVAVYVMRTKQPKTVTNSNTNATLNLVNDHPFDARAGTVPTDGDKDGLTDAEEDQLGTNPTVADTDKDGLSDFDETKIYHSDPKKSDTDGDGNSDGTEVSKGFSPIGPGKLLDTSPSAIKNATP